MLYVAHSNTLHSYSINTVDIPDIHEHMGEYHLTFVFNLLQTISVLLFCFIYFIKGNSQSILGLKVGHTSRRALN